MTERQSTPGEFEQTITIDAPADAIFDFVADVRNLPKYLPTTKRAEPQGADRVRVQGEAHGHRYDADGFMHTDRSTYLLEWGADERYYRGRLQVCPEDAHRSVVNIRLTFHELPGEGETRPSQQDINEGIRASLNSIANHVMGRGGKQEPAAAG